MRRLLAAFSLGALVILSLGVTVLLVAGRGNAEHLLARTFAVGAHRDSFEHIDQFLPQVWSMQSFHLIQAVAAFGARRRDVLTVIVIGPALVLAGCGLSEDWLDPNWYVIAGANMIGCSAGIVVGVGSWLLRWDRQQSA